MDHIKAEKVRQWIREQQETRAAEDLMWGQESNVNWDMMSETGRAGTTKERRQRMHTMPLAT
jgi:hypothetical protein